MSGTISDEGTWTFGYNALGEVLEQTDARNITTTTKYDKLGRVREASATVDIDGIAPLDTVLDTFTYDPAYAKGLEGTQSRTINGALQREIATTYDLLSRPASVAYDNATATPGTFLSLTQETAFDVYYGRPKAQSYGNGETLWLRYSKYGQPIRESDAATGADYRVVTAVDARGNAIAETLAGGELGVAHSYHLSTGQVASIRYANLSNPNLRVLTYAYDVFGNLGQQTLGGATQEDFTYDALHRLTEATRTGTGTGTVQYDYDAVGNFRFKSDFSAILATGDAYSYTGGSCGGGPNAVKSVALWAGSSRSYCYDANGNLTSDSAGLAMKYDHTQRPVQIVRGGITRTFRYDASGSRFWQFGSGESTQYFPGVEKRYGAINDEKTYLGSRTVVTTVGGTRKVEYLLTDRLGSVEAVANADGAMIESRGYDAFGKPRTGTWSNAPNDRLGSTANTPHGFTGHEHLNSLNLIHMNGRVYDYALGRFTGVDPVIQFPLNSQSLNPYSYILNNPLSGTDPTGHTACTTGTHIKGESGFNCEGLGVSGGLSDANTVGHMNGKAVPSKGDNGASAGGSSLIQRLTFNDWHKNSFAANEDAKNSGSTTRMKACRDGTLSCTPSPEAGKAMAELEFIGHLAGETAEFAGEQATDPINWLPVFGPELKFFGGKFKSFFGSFGSKVSGAADETPGIQRAGSGFGAARGANLVGQSFGRVGTVVENPGIAIQGLRGSSVPAHAIDQIINRGVSPALLRSVVDNPTVVLQQQGGRFLYLTNRGAVVITRDGQVVTAWTQREFFPHIRKILDAAGEQ
jgi:RHS repeat-associated protein